MTLEPRPVRRAARLVLSMEHVQELLGLPPTARILGVFQTQDDLASNVLKVDVEGVGHEMLPGCLPPSTFIRRDQDGKLVFPEGFLPGAPACDSPVENTASETGPEPS
jgi:hypothetical protein